MRREQVRSRAARERELRLVGRKARKIEEGEEHRVDQARGNGIKRVRKAGRDS